MSREEFSHLDGLVRDWLQASTDRIRRDWKDGKHQRREWGTTSIDLAIGERAVSFRIRKGRSDGEDPGFSMDSFKGEHLDALCDALRRVALQPVWPIRLRFDLDQGRSWHPLELNAAGLAGILPRGGSFGHIERAGLDEIVESGRLISGLCRPSNRPVRAWSTQDDLVGAAHVHIMGIHARTEAEALLKKLWSHDGVQALRDIAAGKPLPEGRWITDLHFIATDLEDLDTHPMGRVMTGRDALAEIAEAVRFLDPAPDDGDTGMSP
ncbi:hypothetical protein [Paracoccus sp. ME4]|uniref:hypothetical protein n=1 Tax=Paracoccus sp. ME4 TaxID=3138066 RepID=UPI00398B9F4C